MDLIVKEKIKAFYEIDSLQRKLDDLYRISAGVSGVTFSGKDCTFYACIDGENIPFSPEEL